MPASENKEDGRSYNLVLKFLRRAGLRENIFIALYNPVIQLICFPLNSLKASAYCYSFLEHHLFIIYTWKL